MCGIIGYIGAKEATPILVSGLKKLEYRGYDSAGVAVMKNNNIDIVKCSGKIMALEALLAHQSPKGNIGIGHTRWATHGPPNQINAHPHTGCNSEIAVVHNGIIENYVYLREKLISKGHVFSSETDTEVLPHLIRSYFKNDLTLAVEKSIKELEGSYAIAVISSKDDGKIIASRCGSPLVIGIGNKEMFIASDITAILKYTSKIIYLGEKEIATVTHNAVEIKDFYGNIVKKEIHEIDWNAEMTDKSGYKHYMLKEIFQEPVTIRNNLEGRINFFEKKLIHSAFTLPREKIKKVKKIFILACGTSYYAALVSKYIFEELTNLPVEVDYASEFRYRKILMSKNDLTIVISQSGETADTIAALNVCKMLGSHVLAVTNVRGSTISREADSVMYIKAGPEIGVASTKAFVGQLMVLYMTALYLAQILKSIHHQQIQNIISELIKLPQKADTILLKDPEIKLLSEELKNIKNFLYLGRGINYPIALEGALKLKEISYIHAEGYPAGEMKHGPIALLDKTFPVVAIVPRDKVYIKMINNLKEVKARDTGILAIATEDDKDIAKIVDKVFYIPKTSDILYPILSVIPLQLLAYHIADKLQRDADKPRNLAKSVTVE